MNITRYAFLGLLSIASIGCAAANKQTQTARYSLSHPDFWKVKSVAARDGEPTTVIIPQFGDAVIDEGSGAQGPREASYDTVTADVEARIYAWEDTTGAADPTQEVMKLLQRHQDLNLPGHMAILEIPPECNLFKKKYKVAGVQQTPMDLVSRPGFRTIVIGGRQNGVLLGVVARVEYQQDELRYCHDLSNLQVQLQHVLDGITVKPGGAPATPGASPPAPPPAPAPPAAPPPPDATTPATPPQP